MFLCVAIYQIISKIRVASPKYSKNQPYEVSRVFLLGDSMIKSMLPGRFFGQTYDWGTFVPSYSPNDDHWYYFYKFKIRNHNKEANQSYLIGD